ncbi:HAD family phosphatase [Myxococcota bacterium]|nr:HAD family phosphatase [Myxococcota bacterium]MBU1382427.1 HAD family phosphatase [Myxococcota bacterium]MBU1496291.1 HAD family phosphatase [Myxococcota bacterium]
MKPIKVAAFFDFDRTFIDINSGYLYARFEKANKRINNTQFLQSLLWLGLYHLGIADIDSAYSKALALYKGTSESEVKEITEKFFSRDIVSRAMPGALRTLEYHKRMGHYAVLITNSSPYLSKLALEEWGFDHRISNLYNIDTQGRLTGEFERPLCYGKGKTLRAQKFAETEGILLSESYFYTDSISDLDMMENVGLPFAINPDPKLRRAAKKRKWPILNWKH